MNILKDFLPITEDMHVDVKTILFLINHSYEHFTTKSNLRFAIEKKTRKNNSSISFPQRDLYLIK